MGGLQSPLALSISMASHAEEARDFKLLRQLRSAASSRRVRRTLEDHLLDMGWRLFLTVSGFRTGSTNVPFCFFKPNHPRPCASMHVPRSILRAILFSY